MSRIACGRFDNTLDADAALGATSIRARRSRRSSETAEAPLVFLPD